MATAVEVSEIIRNVGLVFAAAVGIGVATWRSLSAGRQAQAALEQSELARRDHTTEVFNRAVGQLAHDRLEVRLGAIYTLRELCLDDRYSAFARPIIETLSAYVRERTSMVERPSPIDIQVIGEMLRDYYVMFEVTNDADRLGTGT